MNAFQNSRYLVLKHCYFLNSARYQHPRQYKSALELLCDASQPEAAHDSAAREQTLETIPSTRYPGFIDILMSWSIQKHTAPPVALITTPKSDLAQLYAERLEGHLAATYFLSDICSNNPTHFVPTIALQLVTRSPAFDKTLNGIIHRNPTILTKSLKIQFRDLILTPLEDLMARDVDLPGVVIVDGFDRFLPRARREILRAVATAVDDGIPLRWVFFSRRVLESYLLLYLTSSKVLKPTHDFHFISMWTLHTYTVGHHVGSKWGLGRVMRWVPTVSKEKLDGPLISDAPVGKDELLKSVGLYKVQGDAVAAVMGAIYEQFGASVAHRAFHTRVLPHLLLDGKNGGLPLVFHDEVREICERMGGAESDLTKAPEATTESSQ
ncbi:hypothetical protein D9756_009452 [Leucocoprinus leucothites]|uniref:Uncharacterized protein n=1 Tax=Leucocoprinus leucothites TaxID=201217 RepID=A0A8H5CXU7_9AGAR|nr:hypothetical protein D9756_009452 [Leucoagaricus leucothites]